MGTAKGRVVIPPSFFEPLDDELASLFAGEAPSPQDPLGPDWTHGP